MGGGERGCWGEGRRGRGDGVGVKVGRGGWGGERGVGVRVGGEGGMVLG